MFRYPITAMTFRRDATGQLYSDSDPEQLSLLGVERVYPVEVRDAHCEDIARLMFGGRYIPADKIRREGVIYLSRQALEKALWNYLCDRRRLPEERAALLRQLRFDARQPYEVLYDEERDLYVFRSLCAKS